MCKPISQKWLKDRWQGQGRFPQNFQQNQKHLHQCTSQQATGLKCRLTRAGHAALFVLRLGEKASSAESPWWCFTPDRKYSTTVTVEQTTHGAGLWQNVLCNFREQRSLLFCPWLLKSPVGRYSSIKVLVMSPHDSLLLGKCSCSFVGLITLCTRGQHFTHHNIQSRSSLCRSRVFIIRITQWKNKTICTNWSWAGVMCGQFKEQH